MDSLSCAAWVIALLLAFITWDLGNIVRELKKIGGARETRER